MSTEDLRSLWTDRIRLLADSVKHRHLCDKIKEDIKTHELFRNSQRFAAFPQDSREQVELQIAKGRSDFQHAKKLVDDDLAQLSKSPPWPVPPLPDPDDHSQVSVVLQQLAQATSQVSDTLSNLRTTVSSADQMEVDPPSPRRSNKRRRVVNDDVPISTLPSLHADGVDPEALGERLTHLEGLFSAFENELSVREDEFRAEIEDAVDAALHRLRPSFSPTVVSDSQFASIKNNQENTDKDIENLADEVANLVTLTDAQQMQIQDVLRQIEESERRLPELQKQFQFYQDARARDLAEIEALQRAIQIYNSRPVATAVSSDQLGRLKGPIQAMVREFCKSHIETLRKDIQQKLDNQSADIQKLVWSKLSLTFKMVQSISQRIEQNNDLQQSQ